MIDVYGVLTISIFLTIFLSVNVCWALCCGSFSVFLPSPQGCCRWLADVSDRGQQQQQQQQQQQRAAFAKQGQLSGQDGVWT